MLSIYKQDWNVTVLFTIYFSAASIGTDMLEIDCHITKDGQVVVSHDSSLKRTCETEGQVSDFKYEVSYIF